MVLLLALLKYIVPILSLAHPLTHCLIYHVYVMTVPAVQLLFGADPMYAGMDRFWAIEPAEYVRALFFADMALVAFSGGSLLADLRNRLPLDVSAGKPFEPEIATGVILTVLAVCLPIGILMFVVERGFTDSAQLSFDSNGYSRTIAMWPVACVIICIFRYGFRWYFMVPLTMYIVYVGTQGYFRFMALLPILFVAMIYLAQRRQRWPSVFGLAIAFALALLFPQLKYIGAAIGAEDSKLAMSNVKVAFFLEEPTSTRSKEELLDPYAGALTLADDFGELYYGKTYAAILTLPFPRSLWPEKPGLGDHIIRMATPDRPYDKEGRAIGYIAEAYMNFGILGVILIPLLLGYFLSKWHLTSLALGIRSPEFLLYLCVASSLIQVFRDGLTSIVVFSIINSAPIMFVVLLHRVSFASATNHRAI